MQFDLNFIKKAKKLLFLILHYLKDNFVTQIFPTKPITLNLLVNDVCNSRCQMCLIWKNKKDTEISPEQLNEILSDSLFSNLKYIGVSGGEPTLRKDLPELFKVICSKKPKILGTGIITNGIIKDTVKQRLLECADICKEHDVSFNVMISLDGLNEVHDEVRGRKNNFQSAISLLDFFHNHIDIPASFGCTITQSNALYVDELLDYAKEQRLYGRFRIAEFIKRLYNSNQTEFIRAFDEKTLYHLGLFFFRAEHNFETDSTYKKTYRNIRGMIAEEKPRQIGCPYQSSAAVLTSHGDLLYCSPKSPNLGNALQVSANKLYFSNLNKRKEIYKKDCHNCIHDYHEPLTIREILNSKLLKRRKNKIYNCNKLIKQSSKIKKYKKDNINLLSLKSKKILIVGWYGTETVGDKAILWSVLNEIRSRSQSPEKIYLSSLFPFVSDWTLKEMKLDEVIIVETYSKEFEKVCQEVDEIVVGGGPLMDIEPLDHILYAFIQGTKFQAITRIEGCGIGPLKHPLYTKVVSEIIRLSDYVTLRDTASTEKCLKEFPVTNLETVNDPATNYVNYVKNNQLLLDQSIPPLGKQKNVACFLREWGKDYAGNLNEIEYSELKNKFESELIYLIIFIAQQYQANIHLLPMHSFSVGGDDRIFNRYLAKSITPIMKNIEPGINIEFTREPVSSLEILQSMYHSEFNICMRFHSVLFAEILGVPYVAIDYTGGGKIKGFLRDKGKLDRLISLDDIAEGKWKRKLTELSITD